MDGLNILSEIIEDVVKGNWKDSHKFIKDIC